MLNDTDTCFVALKAQIPSITIRELCSRCGHIISFNGRRSEGVLRAREYTYVPGTNEKYYTEVHCVDCSNPNPYEI